MADILGKNCLKILIWKWVKQDIEKNMRSREALIWD